MAGFSAGKLKQKARFPDDEEKKKQPKAEPKPKPKATAPAKPKAEPKVQEVPDFSNPYEKEAAREKLRQQELKRREQEKKGPGTETKVTTQKTKSTVEAVRTYLGKPKDKKKKK